MELAGIAFDMRFQQNYIVSYNYIWREIVAAEAVSTQLLRYLRSHLVSDCSNRCRFNIISALATIAFGMRSHLIPQAKLFKKSCYHVCRET